MGPDKKEERTIKLNKRIIAMIGATAMAVPLAVCGDSDLLSSQPAQESDVKEITVWAWDPTLT